jgi:hypothetical protein
MKISVSTKKTEAIEKTAKYGCDFCGRSFLRESTIANHICEYKQRHLNKDLLANRIGFQAWVQFYQKNTNAKKTKTYDEFIRSAYFTAFVKFGLYCSEIHALNIPRFVEWLLKNQVKIDTWNTDTVYTKFLLEYLREEDPLDAIHRSIETTIKLAEPENIQPHDVLRYANKYKVCYAITTGKISPWMLYQSKSGVQFIDSLDETQIKMVINYIDPEKWALKFHRDVEGVKQVKELLNVGGY